MKTIAALIVGLFFWSNMQAQTELRQTQETFKNGQFVWEVIYNGQRAGEFWPVRGLNLVTKQTDPEIFLNADLADIQKALGGVATAPDGMTGGSFGSYVMQGKSLSNGRPCGDGVIYDYGIIIVRNGFNIIFTHKQAVADFDSLYGSLEKAKETLFFLPSIFRNDNYLISDKLIDKVFVRRETYGGDQIGVVIFDKMVTCDQARKIVLGLDRPGKSKTTHIYILDGGNVWGQCAKEVNGRTKLIGTRNKEAVTNYLVFY